MNFLSDLMRNLSFSISGLVAVPFLIIAIVFFFLWARSRWKTGSAKGWPSTTGKVISSEMEARRSRSGSGYSTAYYAVVLYEYIVNGQRLQSNRLTLGTPIGTGFTGGVQKKLQQYPVGSRVEVFYNPDDPTEAVLEIKAPSGSIYLFIALLIVAILVVTMVFTAGGIGFASQIIDRFTSNVPR